MKTAIAILALWVAAASAALGQATVNFHLQDSFGRILPLRRVQLQPVLNLAPATNGIGQITGDYLSFITDTNGNASVTNVMSGTYQQLTYGQNIVTTNYLLIPSTTNSINAKDWVTLYPTGIGFLLYNEAGVVGGKLTFEP